MLFLPRNSQTLRHVSHGANHQNGNMPRQEQQSHILLTWLPDSLSDLQPTQKHQWRLGMDLHLVTILLDWLFIYCISIQSQKQFKWVSINKHIHSLVNKKLEGSLSYNLSFKKPSLTHKATRNTNDKHTGHLQCSVHWCNKPLPTL